MRGFLLCMERLRLVALVPREIMLGMISVVFSMRLRDYCQNSSRCLRSRKDRQIFIKAKYVDRKYVMVLPNPVSSSQGQRLRRWTVSRRKTKKASKVGF